MADKRKAKDQPGPQGQVPRTESPTDFWPKHDEDLNMGVVTSEEAAELHPSDLHQLTLQILVKTGDIITNGVVKFLDGLSKWSKDQRENFFDAFENYYARRLAWIDKNLFSTLFIALYEDQEYYQHNKEWLKKIMEAFKHAKSVHQRPKPQDDEVGQRIQEVENIVYTIAQCMKQLLYVEQSMDEDGAASDTSGSSTESSSESSQSGLSVNSPDDSPSLSLRPTFIEKNLYGDKNLTEEEAIEKAIQNSIKSAVTEARRKSFSGSGEEGSSSLVESPQRPLIFILQPVVGKGKKGKWPGYVHPADVEQTNGVQKDDGDKDHLPGFFGFSWDRYPYEQPPVEQPINVRAHLEHAARWLRFAVDKMWQSVKLGVFNDGNSESGQVEEVTIQFFRYVVELADYMLSMIEYLQTSLISEQSFFEADPNYEVLSDLASQAQHLVDGILVRRQKTGDKAAKELQKLLDRVDGVSNFMITLIPTIETPPLQRNQRP